MPIAAIAFDFDPLLRLSDDLVVRWQTVALAVVVAAVLVVAGLMAQRSRLRPDDLLYIVIGVVPGAVIGGRIGYALTHLDGFAPDPLRLLDPAAGGLDLAAAVVGGVLTGAYVASLLGAPIGRWAHLAALTLLVAIGAGKLTMILGGSGQGLPSDAAWATAFLPPGPWSSLAAALPSHPSQAYEGIATLIWATVLALVAGTGLIGRRDGRLLLAAIAGWAFLRAAVSVTWRDQVVLGPFSAGGLLAIAIGIGSVALLVVVVGRGAGAPEEATTSTSEPAWPDPETRPRF